MKKKSFIIAIFLVIFDQLIKLLIDKYELLFEKIIVPNFFYLTKVYNTGAAWSTLSGARFLLIAFSIMAFILLFKYQENIQINKRNILAFGLIYGGLIGNLIDRLRLGYVIDYIGFYIFKYQFPVFNLADSFIVVGFSLLIYAIFKGEDLSGSKCRKIK